MRLPLIAALALAAASPLAAQTPATAPAAAKPAAVKLTPAQETHLLALGKKYTQWFLGGNADSMVAAMDPVAFEKMGGLDGMLTMMGQISERAGTEVKIVAEKMTYRNGQPQFWHEGSFSEFTDDTLVFRWILNVDGKITGAGIQPKSAAPEPDPMD